jgi:hypothetical protein
MIIVEYQPNIPEITNATLNFLERRPIIKVIILLMKICCVIMSAAYILKAIMNTITIHDMLVLLFALTWLFGYRVLNGFILKKILGRQNITKAINKFHINKYKLWWQATNKQPMQQEWKYVTYIYQNPNGYIVPLIGAANAGKFIWLPKRGFAEPAAENKFLELIKQLKIIIK